MNIKTYYHLAKILCACSVLPVSAEVVFDGSIGPNAAGVTRSGDFTITEADGVVAGSNLFHSFDEFAVESTETANFTAGPRLDNIIARVTGSYSGNLTASNIDGVLNADTNLFLLNPAGVMIGEGSTLNVEGAFFASEQGSSFVPFSDGSNFDASSIEGGLSIASPKGFGFLADHNTPLIWDGSASAEPEGFGAAFCGQSYCAPSTTMGYLSVDPATGQETVIFSFDSLNVPKGYEIKFLESAQLKDMVIRVTGNEPSWINGTLKNGTQGSSLWLSNSAGIVLADGSNVTTTHGDGGNELIITTAHGINFDNGARLDTTETNLLTGEFYSPDTLDFTGSLSKGVITLSGHSFGRANENVTFAAGSIFGVGKDDGTPSVNGLYVFAGNLNFIGVRNANFVDPTPDISVADASSLSSFMDVDEPGLELGDVLFTDYIIEGQEFGAAKSLRLIGDRIELIGSVVAESEYCVAPCLEVGGSGFDINGTPEFYDGFGRLNFFTSPIAGDLFAFLNAHSSGDILIDNIYSSLHAEGEDESSKGGRFKVNAGANLTVRDSFLQNTYLSSSPHFHELTAVQRLIFENSVFRFGPKHSLENRPAILAGNSDPRSTITLQANDIDIINGSNLEIDNPASGGGQVSNMRFVISADNDFLLKDAVIRSGTKTSSLNPALVETYFDPLHCCKDFERDAGSITIGADIISIISSDGATNPAQIIMERAVSANGSGNISLTAIEQIYIQGAESNISAIVGADDLVYLNQASPETVAEIGSKIMGQGFEGSSEQSQINITAPKIHVNGASINAGTMGYSDAGKINLSADSVVLSSGSQISSNSNGAGLAGDINITATNRLEITKNKRSVPIDDADGSDADAAILTSSTQSGGGNVTIEVRDYIGIVNSDIVTKAAGDGGNISIDPQLLFFDGARLDSSAVAGNGGKITVIADNIIRSQDTVFDSRSEAGVDGEVAISGLTNEVGQLETLSVAFSDVSDMLSQKCLLGDLSERSSFAVTQVNGYRKAPGEYQMSEKYFDAELAGNKQAYQKLAALVGSTECFN